MSKSLLTLILALVTSLSWAQTSAVVINPPHEFRGVWIATVDNIDWPLPKQYDVEEHKRGFEFHAWLNPYRANFNINTASIAPNHVTRMHPEWFVEYGGKKYFDPGNKEGQKWVTDVVRDIVKRYDVDAIHMDDYF